MVNKASWRPIPVVLISLAIAACQQTPGSQTTPTGPTPKEQVRTDAAALAPDGKVEIIRNPSPESAGEPLPEFRAALLVPLSGPHSRTGEAMLNAAQLALFETAGDRFTLLPVDTNGTPEGAASAAERAVADGAHLLLGPMLGSGIGGAAEAAKGRGLPVVAFSNDRGALRSGVYLSGHMPRDAVERILDHASASGASSLGIIASDTEYGRLLVRAAREAARANRMTITREAFVSPDQEANQLSKAVRVFLRGRKRPPPFDAVLIAAPAEDAKAIAPLLAFHGAEPQRVRYLGVGGWSDSGLAQEHILIGARYADTPPHLRSEFKGRYRKAYGADPVPLAELAYDMIALSAALTATGEPGAFDTGALEAPGGYLGASGLFRFGSDGAIQRSLAVIEIGPEGRRVVEPAPERFGPSPSS